VSVAAPKENHQPVVGAAEAAIYAGIFSEYALGFSDRANSEEAPTAQHDGGIALKEPGFAAFSDGAPDIEHDQVFLDGAPATGLDDSRSDAAFRIGPDVPQWLDWRADGSLGTDVANLGSSGFDRFPVAAAEWDVVSLKLDTAPAGDPENDNDDAGPHLPRLAAGDPNDNDQAAQPAVVLNNPSDHPANPGESAAHTTQTPADDAFDNLNNVATAIANTAAVNRPPAADNDSYATPAGTALHVDAAKGVLSGDIDADSFKFAAAVTNAPAHGQLTLSPDGSFDYVPEQGFTGTDSFTYTAHDGFAHSNVATVSIDVTKQIPPPLPHDVLLV
jgi:VCBS repeat-containing protein